MQPRTSVRCRPSGDCLGGVRGDGHPRPRARGAAAPSRDRNRRAPRRDRQPRRQVEPRTRIRRGRDRHAQRARGLHRRRAWRGSSSLRAARPMGTTPTIRSGSPRTTPSGATRHSRTRITSDWSRRCSPTTGAATRNCARWCSGSARSWARPRATRSRRCSTSRACSRSAARAVPSCSSGTGTSSVRSSTRSAPMRRGSTTSQATARSASRKSPSGSASAACTCRPDCCAPSSPCCIRCACRATDPSRSTSCATGRCWTTAG